MTEMDVAGVGVRSRTAVATVRSGARPANDPIASPVALTGSSGVVNLDLNFASLQTGEPSPVGALPMAGTVWYSINPAGMHLMTFTATASGGDPVDNIGLDVYVDDGGADVTTLAPVGGAVGVPASVVSSPSTSYLVRAYPLGPGVGNADNFRLADNNNLRLAYAVLPPPVNLTVSRTVVEVPGVLQASLAQDLANTSFDLTFDSDPTVVLTVTTDSDGNMINFPITIPTTLSDGSHLLKATGGGEVGTASFVVSHGDYTGPDATDPADPAVIAPSTARWRFQDPTIADPTAAVWAFPINPKTHDSLRAARTIQATPTTAISGRPILTEGTAKAKLVTLTGELLHLTDVAVLRTWKRPWRVYMTDDLGRTFLVKVVSVTCTPAQVASHMERHTFEVKVLLYRRMGA